MIWFKPSNKASSKTPDCPEQKSRRSVNWKDAILAWLSLPWLGMASLESLERLDVELIPPTPQHLNRVTWLVGFPLLFGLSWLGQGAWDWQIAVAVGAIFGSNSYNRQKFGLGEARIPLWTALLLIAVGLACAFGLKGPGTELALAALALHLVWSLLQGRVGK